MKIAYKLFEKIICKDDSSSEKTSFSNFFFVGNINVVTFVIIKCTNLFFVIITNNLKYDANIKNFLIISMKSIIQSTSFISSSRSSYCSDSALIILHLLLSQSQGIG